MQSDADDAKRELEAAFFKKLIRLRRLGVIVRRHLGRDDAFCQRALTWSSAILLTICTGAKSLRYTASVVCCPHALGMCLRRSTEVLHVLRLLRCLNVCALICVFVGTSGATVRLSLVPSA